VAPLPVTINGKSCSVPQGATIRTHLAGLGIDPPHVVVEVNGVIVKKEKFEKHLINDGDKLEIVRFVGGG
jgi:sulfur carrier protein